MVGVVVVVVVSQSDEAAGPSSESSPRGKEKLWDVVLCTPAFMACASGAGVWSSPAGLQEMRSFSCWRWCCPCCAAVQELSGAATCSSLPLPAKPPGLELAARPGRLPERAAFRGRRLSRNPGQVPGAKACCHQLCVTGWCHPAQDGWASSGLGFPAEGGSS